MECSDVKDLLDELYKIHKYIVQDEMYIAGTLLKGLQGDLIEYLKLNEIEYDPSNPRGYKGKQAIPGLPEIEKVINSSGCVERWKQERYKRDKDE